MQKGWKMSISIVLKQWVWEAFNEFLPERVWTVFSVAKIKWTHGPVQKWSKGAMCRNSSGCPRTGAVCEKSPSEWASFILQNLSEHLLHAVLSLWRQHLELQLRRSTCTGGTHCDRFRCEHRSFRSRGRAVWLSWVTEKGVWILVHQAPPTAILPGMFMMGMARLCNTELGQYHFLGI